MSDNHKRVFDGDVVQCGCCWVKVEGEGDRLVECLLHKEATYALVAKFERERDE